jgi:Ni,Fe-hydrogenase III large subunit
MNWATAKNGKTLALKDIPDMPLTALRDEIATQLLKGSRMVVFFGTAEKLYAVVAEDDNSRLLISSASFRKDKAYPSLTGDFPALHIFERELYEEYGIIPEGHPWLKGVRYPFYRHHCEKKMETYPFFEMEGEEVHEVAVGPIHAGVIEPGHFRFMCQGENVYHLEIQLGYQHRGVERLFTGRRFQETLAESVAGDSVIAHVTAYSMNMESLGGIEPSRRANAIRAIALEMERAGIHIGDLGALANDVAYLLGNSVYGATRTLVINSLLAICGSRFGRGLIRVGGVVFDMNTDMISEIKKALEKVHRDVILMSETMFSTPSVLSRFEQTGVVDKETARQIGLVGPAGRASGLLPDVRSDHPFGMYRYSPIHKMTMTGGDVFARAYIRYMEIMQSLNYVLEQLDNLPSDGIALRPVRQLAPESFAVSMTEGWRGETVHAAITGKDGNLVRYKIKDPSFHNWFGLAQAVRGNGISDFPLCNKSFNLSYCGNDL